MPCHPQGGRDLKRENWSLRQKAEEIAFGFFFLRYWQKVPCSQIFIVPVFFLSAKVSINEEQNMRQVENFS